MADIAERILSWRGSCGERRHLFIGMGGGSAAGKTTIATEIQERLEPVPVEIIHQDRFFKPADQLPTYYSPTDRAYHPNYNRPDSFDVEPMFAYCREARGEGVILLEGILALHYPELRELMDIQVYVRCDADERIIRRLLRKRPPWPLEKMSNYYMECVRVEHERYNAPTERFADLVIPGGRDDASARSEMIRDLCEPVRRAFDSKETGAQ